MSKRFTAFGACLITILTCFAANHVSAQCQAYATANASTQPGPSNDWVRVNQVGYLTADTKVAIAFSNNNLSGLTFSIVRVSDGAAVFGPTAFPASSGAYSPFANTYKLNFSAFQPSGAGTYKIHLSDGYDSLAFGISPCLYQGTEETILNFYLGQRCGTDNKYAGAACHLAPGSGSSRMDGKVADGPNVGTLIDTEGGWHDSGDFIKFMITTTWSCASLLVAYRDNPTAFQDNLNAHGQAGPNGIPDVLDEAKYALDWIMKMNPDANTLYYQVGGQEDHNLGLGTLPQNDTSAYSTSPYRPVYEGTHGGGSNNCGRAAACLALAYQIWNARGDTAYANQCLTHATQLYALGKAQAYNQPANPTSFYTESGFNADMEWGAAELYRATGTAAYLTDAMTYANAAGSGGGNLDWSTCNFLAHYSLYPLVSAANQTTLKGYMQSGVQAFQNHYSADIYGMNTAYNWGSMETLTGGILEAQLYDKLFGVTTYDSMATASRDFLLGKNPWGVCYIVGMGTITAHHPQHNITVGKCIDIPGMPIEGPDTATDYGTQGIALSGPDAYAAFQGTGTAGVYHDDIQDFATNEPTSTHAGLCAYVFANLAAAGSCSVVTPTATTVPATSTPTSTPSKTPTKTTTQTPSSTPTNTLTASPTSTGTASATASSTSSPSPSRTPTTPLTATGTPSSTASRTASSTPSPTLSSTPSFTPTFSATPVSATNTPTATPTATVAAAPLDFSIWELQEPTGATISPAQLSAGYSDSYFYIGTDGGQALMDPQTGTTTGGSAHPRSELREMLGGSPAAWAPTGTNALTVTGSVSQVGGGAGGHVTLAQVFDSTGGFPLAELQYSNSLGGFQLLYEEARGAGSYINLSTPWSLNSQYSFILSLSNGVLTVTINGTTVYTHTPGAGVQGDQFYFKVGNYDQTATAGTVSTIPYTVVEAYSIHVLHITGATPTPTASATPSSTGTLPPTSTSTLSQTPTSSATLTGTPSSTGTASPTSTASTTPTPSPTPSSTPTWTGTPTASMTFSPTSTATHSFTPTLTSTSSSTATFTATYSFTPKATFTPTSTVTSTFTPSTTFTNTLTTTPSSTPTGTPTYSFTPTLTATNTPTFTCSTTSTFTPTTTLTSTPLISAQPVVYPNPSTSSGQVRLRVFLDTSGEVKVKLFTTAFRKVWEEDFLSEPAGENRLVLNLHNIANGIFYLVIEAPGKRWTIKLLVLG